MPVMRIYNDNIGGDGWKRDFEIPIIVSSNNNVNTDSKVSGILVNRNFNSVTHDIGVSSYTVPENKFLVLTHLLPVLKILYLLYTCD